jgi:ABC-type Fe3+/spermidine/putrescine transport system ATPase subunit
MFQEYALFPHKDVLGNVSFGLRMAGWDGEAIQERVSEVLSLVGLEGFERRDVSQLSGGERQRVALARSLAPQPRLLMLDEPLGALDRSLRERLLREIPAILKQVGITTITVTHDQEEAFAMADQVVVMRAGRVVQQGTPEAVYRHPASAWVARFLGMNGLLDARIVGSDRVETALGILHVRGVEKEAGEAAKLLVRPEAARWEDQGVNCVEGIVVERSFLGGAYRLTVQFDQQETLVFEWPLGERVPDVTENVVLSLAPSHLTLLAEDEVEL